MSVKKNKIFNCAEKRSTAQYGGDLVTLRNVMSVINNIVNYEGDVVSYVGYKK